MSADGAVDFVRQSELEQQIVQGIQTAMAEVDGWIMLNCFFTQAGGYARAEIEWFRPDMSDGSVPVPPVVMHGFVALRDAMWNPQSRPWLSVHVQGNNAGTFSFGFNYERRFDIEAEYKNAFELTSAPVPTDADLIDDLARFPRSAEMLPAWYPAPPQSAEPAASAPQEAAADAVPTPQQAALIAHGRQVLDRLNPNAQYAFELWPEDGAVYVWQLGFGIGQIVVGEDGTALFGGSTLWRDPMLELWRSGRRTAADDLTRAAEQAEERRRAEGRS